MKTVFRLAIPMVLLLLGCSNHQPATQAPDPAEDYLVNRAKWEAAKATISRYRIEESYSGMTGWSMVVVDVDTATDGIISCELRLTEWGQAESITDCMTDRNFHKRIEDYFQELGTFINSGEITRYKFDPSTGVPLLGLGKEPNAGACADCGTPGFEITFKIL